MKFIVIICSLISCFAFANANNEEPELKVIQIAENVYQHISYKMIDSYGMVPASGLVVVDGSDAHIIDTPWTIADTENLITWIKSKGLTLKSSVVTHFHEDASGGIALLNTLQIKTYATTLTNKLLALKKRQQSSEEISNNPFALVNGLVEVFYPGAGHTQDNVVIWLPKEKILFGGCFVKNLQSKNLGYIGNASITDWPKSIQNLLNKYPNIQTVIPGHGKVGDMSLLMHTQQLALSAIGN